MERLLGDLTSRNTDQGRRPGGSRDLRMSPLAEGGWLSLVVGKDGCGGNAPSISANLMPDGPPQVARPHRRQPEQ